MELELGTLLKKARQEKGLSIEDIQTETKIRKKYIEAIENNEFDKLPGKVYLKVFIKGYAREVDINYQALLDNYKVLNTSEKRKTNLDKDYLNGTKVDHKVNKKKKGSTLKIILIILLIIFLTGLGVYTYQYFSNSDIRLLGEQNNIENKQVIDENNELLEEGAQSEEKIEKNDNAQSQTDEQENIENNNSSINLDEETADNQLENTESDLNKEELNKLIEEGENSKILNSLNSNGISDQDTKIVTNETEDNLVENKSSDDSSDTESSTDSDSGKTANSAAAENKTNNDSENNNEQQNQTAAEQQESNETANISENNTASEEDASALNQETTTAEEESSTENKNNEETSAADNITLNADETVWLTVSADGENIFSGIWENGDQDTFKFEDRLYIKIGNGSAITANIGEQEYGPWAGSGEIAEVEFIKSDGEININNLRN